MYMCSSRVSCLLGTNLNAPLQLLPAICELVSGAVTSLLSLLTDVPKKNADWFWLDLDDPLDFMLRVGLRVRVPFTRKYRRRLLPNSCLRHSTGLDVVTIVQ
jgi:hypothetical protein